MELPRWSGAIGIKSLRACVAFDGDGPDARELDLLRSRLRELCQVVASPRLARYLAVAEARLGRVVLVSQHWPNSVRSALAREPLPEARVRVIVHGALEALCCLRSLGVVHRNVCPETLLLADGADRVVLADWGMHHALRACPSLGIVVGHPAYCAPECWAHPHAAVYASDLWSLAVCAVEMLTRSNPFAAVLDDVPSASRVLGVGDGPRSGALDHDSNSRDAVRAVLDVDECSRELRDVLLHCLEVNPCLRWSCTTALLAPVFAAQAPSQRWSVAPHLPSLSFTASSVRDLYPDVDLTPSSPSATPEPTVGSPQQDPPAPAVVPDVVAPHRTEPDTPACLTALLQFASTHRDGFALVFPELQLPYDHATLGCAAPFDPTVYLVEEAELLERARAVREQGAAFAARRWMCDGLLSDPTVEERERDVGYQRKRVHTFRELLLHNNERALRREAGVDVPPVLRAPIWAVLLKLPSEEQCLLEWGQVDADAEGPSDHQIAVDVPRCNARHEILGTTEGRRTLTRVLKAWVASNPELEYWQGLDSLSAPFVALNWQERDTSLCEARAFAMLQRMVRRYLSGMFLQRNTNELQTQLIVFNQLLAYHDPQLFNHLRKQQFSPELFAIPWFLTLFTHILPLESTLRLWDFLFLHDATMVHFISVAVMRQLRKQLLAEDFNELVLFFSELHGAQLLDMAGVVRDAVKFAAVTPPSLCTDQSTDDPRRWWEQKTPLDVLKQHYSPRMSVADLLQLRKEGRVPVAVFDVRPPEEWRQGHLDGSINLRAVDVDLRAVEDLRRRKAVLVIIAEKGKEVELTNRLVGEAAVPRVCYLNGGIDALVWSRVKLKTGDT